MLKHFEESLVKNHSKKPKINNQKTNPKTTKKTSKNWKPKTKTQTNQKYHKTVNFGVIKTGLI